MRRTLFELNPEEVSLVLAAMWLMARSMQTLLANDVKQGIVLDPGLQFTPDEMNTLLGAMLVLTRAFKESPDFRPGDFGVDPEALGAPARALRLAQSM